MDPSIEMVPRESSGSWSIEVGQLESLRTLNAIAITVLHLNRQENSLTVLRKPSSSVGNRTHGSEPLLSRLFSVVFHVGSDFYRLRDRERLTDLQLRLCLVWKHTFMKEIL